MPFPGPPCDTVQCCVQKAGLAHANAIYVLVEALKDCMAEQWRNALQSDLEAKWNSMASNLESIGNDPDAAGHAFDDLQAADEGIGSTYQPYAGNCWEDAWAAFLAAIVQIREDFLACLGSLP